MIDVISQVRGDLKYQNDNDNENNELIVSSSNDKTIKIWKKIPSL